MKLKTPVTGTIIEVRDDDAKFYISRGFEVVKPVKRTARKRTTKAKGQ